VPITIHPPNPALTEIPLRVNVGEPQQTIILHGRHLERIEKISSAGAEWILRQNPEGAVDLNVRSLTIRLSPTARKGDQLSAEIFVNGLAKPLSPHISVRREKARISSGCETHPVSVAPAGSNRSGDGGNEVTEAFGVEGRIGDLASMQAVT
jgi:hypothetical protein